ncbi:hypothetical protein ACL6C3_13545 [Capilliphycus salinus ALCB114379]
MESVAYIIIYNNNLSGVQILQDFETYGLQLGFNGSQLGLCIKLRKGKDF